MSITDELRDWMRARGMMAKETFDQLAAIADRIDAEYESACAEAYGNGVMSVPIALDESQWVKLPVDADGVPIHVGDRVQFIGNDPSTVSHMSLADDGWRVYVKYDGGIGTGSGEPKRIRHHYATVEDVLREFGDWYAHVKGGCDEDGIVAEFAAKLRLAEEE